MKRFLTASLVLVPLVGHAQSTHSSDELAKRVEAMASIPSTFSPMYSRDGKRIALISNRSGTPQAWMVDAAGGEAKQVTQGSDPVGSVKWSPVEDRIAYDVARGGGFNAQVYYSKPDGSDARLITSGGKEDNFFAASRRMVATGSAPHSVIRSRPIRGSSIRRLARRRSPSSTTADSATSTTSSGLPTAHWSVASSLAAIPTCTCTTFRQTRRSC
jgi:hypothetical protein